MDLIDDLDKKILEYYRNDHRIRASELSKILQISRGTLRSRIRNLIDKNILRGFVSVVDPRGLGFDTTAFFYLKTNPHEPWLLDQIKSLPNADFIAGISGIFSLLGRFRLRHEYAFSALVHTIDSLMARSGSRTYRIIRVVDIFKEAGIVVKAHPKRQVDDKDIHLLKRLAYQKCSSAHYTPLSSLQLASEMALSQPAVYKRVKRLEQDKILLGFSIDVHWARIYGAWIGFVVQIKVAFDKISDVALQIAKFSEVYSLYRTTEEYLLLGLLWVRSVADFNKFLLKCYKIPGIEDTQSILMLDVSLERSPVTVLEKSMLVAQSDNSLSI